MLDLDAANQMRGELISKMNILEGMVDIALCNHYGFDADDPQFRGWLLGRLNMERKIEVLREVLLHHDLLDAERLELIRDLNALRVERNHQAHASVAPHFDGLSDLTSRAVRMNTEELSAAIVQVNEAGLRSTKVTRGGLTSRPESLDDLRAWVERADRLFWSLASLGWDIHQLREAGNEPTG